MGRANIYLSDELERRVRAAKIPLSEVCQQALLAAVEAAETGAVPLGADLSGCFRSGWTAGTGWVTNADVAVLLRLLRDLQLSEIPRDALPEHWFSFSDQQTLAWEAGFVEAARTAVRGAMAADLPNPTLPARTPAAPVPDDQAADDQAADESDAPEAGDLVDAASEGATAGAASLEKTPRSRPGRAPLGDTSSSFVGVDTQGRRVAFDPHSAPEAGKSPLFAVLGPADERAAFTLSVGQDAAARGTAVVIVDLSGTFASRARGLGRNVRVIRPAASPLPNIEELMRGGGNLRGVWESVAGLASGGGLFAGAPDELVKPGYVTVVSTGGDGALSGMLAAAQAARTLAGLTSMTDHRRLLQVDLPSGITIPGAVASLLTRQINSAREHDVAFGLSAESASTLTGVGGTGALLSTVFGFATTSPVEADRLRDLLGAQAPVLLSPPGSGPRRGDEAWCVMRDLQGRLGQVRIDTL